MTRSSRAKPQGGGYELFVWYAILLSGLSLFVLALAHLLLLALDAKIASAFCRALTP